MTSQGCFIQIVVKGLCDSTIGIAKTFVRSFSEFPFSTFDDVNESRTFDLTLRHQEVFVKISADSTHFHLLCCHWHFSFCLRNIG